jgi:hypothetical protein
MDSYFSNMKEDMGLNKKPNDAEEEFHLEEVLQSLRPNTTAKNFKEFLSRADNMTRSQHWKGISRKVDKSPISKSYMYKRAASSE